MRQGIKPSGIWKQPFPTLISLLINSGRMNRITGCILLGILFMASCQKNNEPRVVPEGTYIGTFTRVGLILAGSDSVKITFTGNKFSGESYGHSNSPRICNGDFQIMGDSVSFHNACIFTADFDWTLILSGHYKISTEADNLTISRMYLSSSSYSDTYSLKKQ
jgi:hypothetical protein